MLHFYPAPPPWKRQETFDFLTFSGGTEIEHGLKWVNAPQYKCYIVFNVDSEQVSVLRGRNKEKSGFETD